MIFAGVQKKSFGKKCVQNNLVCGSCILMSEGLNPKTGHWFRDRSKFAPSCCVFNVADTVRQKKRSAPLFSQLEKNSRVVAQRSRNCLQRRRPGFNPWVGKIPRRKAWQPTPVFLSGKSHGQRSLVGYIVHGVAKSQTRLKRLSAHTQMPTLCSQPKQITVN